MIKIFFDNISNGLQNIFKNFARKGKVTETDLKNMLREVRMTFLEADVNYQVVRELEKRIYEKAIGAEILKSLTPDQQIIKIINDELVDILGSAQSGLTFGSKLSVYMLVGLQGAGKTTLAGKLAKKLKSQSKKVLLVACDTFRAAAVQQLKILGDKIGVEVFSLEGETSAIKIAEAGKQKKKKNNFNIVIIDTAGRLDINNDLMAELQAIKSVVRPHEILIVVDAMGGQEAVKIASSFNEKLGLDGIVFTKLDGDTRGGAVLSIKFVTGIPIKFIGVGEGLEDLEEFYPDRMASRILGNGDVLSLIEKAQEKIGEEEFKKQSEKVLKNNFDLNDLLEQMKAVKKLGPIKNLLKMIPGINKIDLSQADPEDELKKVSAIICSMTKQERENPDIIDASRKRRIANGCKRSVNEINLLLKRFEEMKKMMQMLKDKKFNLFGN